MRRRSARTDFSGEGKKGERNPVSIGLKKVSRCSTASEYYRPLELIWLSGRLAPDFKTIADFRKGQRTGDPEGMSGICSAVPESRSLFRSHRGDRWQQVQGGQ
jgi:hypothetical protein